MHYSDLERDRERTIKKEIILMNDYFWKLQLKLKELTARTAAANVTENRKELITAMDNITKTVGDLNKKGDYYTSV